MGPSWFALSRTQAASTSFHALHPLKHEFNIYSCHRSIPKSWTKHVARVPMIGFVGFTMTTYGAPNLMQQTGQNRRQKTRTGKRTTPDKAKLKTRYFTSGETYDAGQSKANKPTFSFPPVDAGTWGVQSRGSSCPTTVQSAAFRYFALVSTQTC